MKKAISTAVALTLVLGLALTSQAAANIECKVMASKENTLIMNCGKEAGAMKVGSKVQLQAQKNTKQKTMTIEGC